ncbi:unnamed protein product [Brassica oleracea var. botrytis]|uniref:Uncharacterized protein n=1 Tax=Brassica oleracea TaxID=3712 RepID=A0A3P6G0I4_BRAOL|nr:unnamed protein product [Brassica oleracea]
MWNEGSGVWRRSVFYFPTKSITREPFPSKRKPRMSFHQASTESMDSMMDSTADSITTIKRPTDVPESGQLCDLLWSDQAKMSMSGG